jgi:hypothetical protein
MRRWLISICGITTALLSTGCRGEYLYVANVGSPPAASKPAGCSIHVVNTWGYPGYVQIGFVEWDGKVGVARTLEEFYQEAQEPVCKAGGDVLLAQPSPDGKYVRGIVLKQIGQAGPAPQ